MWSPNDPWKKHHESVIISKPAIITLEIFPQKEEYMNSDGQVGHAIDLKGKGRRT